jgi:hypothetical protein
MKTLASAIAARLTPPLWVLVAIAAASYASYGVGVRRDLAKPRVDGVTKRLPEATFRDTDGIVWECDKWRTVTP